MGIIGGQLGYRLLKHISPAPAGESGAPALYSGAKKMETLFGSGVWREIAGKTVVDFGCGEGAEAIEMAKRGAKHVTGIDIRPEVLARASRAAAAAGVANRCHFTTRTDVRADVIFSVDAFEHFADPALILDLMAGYIDGDGMAWISFGPTWYHPNGGHLLSVFPWAHLLFTESALLRWRSDFKTDGARRFSEVEGGLNQITIARFCSLVEKSPLQFSSFENVPIRGLWPLAANPLTREFFTSIVRCRLSRRRPVVTRNQPSHTTYRKTA
ncbi:MAG: methyltransferase domain-containing protein [Bryobacteraceae bacterium]|nr:methyltransferase domain-containing protein [Bryobacteraceae bacterium]